MNWKKMVHILLGFAENFLAFGFLVLVIGIPVFLIGEALPRKWFHYERAPFSSFAWENGGKVYQRLSIQKWKDRMPDMSKWIKSAVNKSILAGDMRDPKYIDILIRETCVAEFVHFFLVLLSPVFYFAMGKGILGFASMLAYAAGNVPFIMIQRYNRPRLEKILKVLQKQEYVPSRAATEYAQK